ncbi:hypothetical protein JK364_26685 [Streptomyces sp. 110]|uniref:Uncharacterized protein n=1 Tax=Streptomyces endocoffeicus TaxID=2898945 RepID=A0ABS1PUJ4_9ACTN|nr:hypothetical protein [Streptomyces endocoffeicus]MBL1115964.1 hypothetical protein [Streptomyces endocoffeicus]
MVAALALMLVARFTKVRLERRRDPPMVALCGATGMTALPGTAAPLSLHPLVQPVRDVVPVPNGGGGSAPRG